MKPKTEVIVPACKQVVENRELVVELRYEFENVFQMIA
jgi:hypothetical protein